MKLTNIEKQEVSKQIYCAKMIAIISVCFAHCYYDNHFLTKFNGYLGSFGVPLFLIISGYYYNYKSTISDTIVQKAKKILIPYVVFSVITYYIQYVFGLIDLNIVAFLNWIVGNGTWLYYVPAVFTCYIIFTIYIKFFDKPAVLLVAFWMMSMLKIKTGFTFINAIPLFMVYFASGYIINKRKVIINIKPSLLHLIFSLAVLIIMYMFEIPSLIENLMRIYISAEIINFSYLIKDVDLFQNIGKNTYLIYFLHAQVGIGISNVIFSLILGYNVKSTTSVIAMLLRPLFAFGICVLFIDFILILSRKININKYLYIVGIKEDSKLLL